MEIPFDVADLPVALMRWDSNKLCENDLLRVPSLDDVCNWVPSKAIQFIDDLDEASDLSLGSSPSDASTRLNNLEMGFTLDLDLDCVEGGTLPQFIPMHATTSKPLPPIQLPITALHLKLDTSRVIQDWTRLAGNSARPVFSMPRNQLSDIVATIPSYVSRMASISPSSQPELAGPSSNGESMAQAPSAVVGKPAPTMPKPAAKSLKKSSSHKRPRSSNDKRPRFKGRFVKREELQQLLAADDQVLSECSESALVPDKIDFEW